MPIQELKINVLEKQTPLDVSVRASRRFTRQENSKNYFYNFQYQIK
jgi:hypothetical protein